ncbi:MAG: glycoside hydrolase family 3 C-terminal domain-containing protein [Cytophagaceae bacterium]|nr:glycoside hydrolase family 3 C-terminal domain-containing protein [Cytophagaceae bacterium]MBL0326057.1 glycoside hydrolase family 3 C-terminal domain-containing protein [Cytophagaceae bacterium]
MNTSISRISSLKINLKIITISFFVSFSFKSIAQDYKSFPMWDSNLTREQRINDLVSRLTLDEKVRQMIHSAPSIPHLGIPAYDWWSETLHGVARTPYSVTVYPQAIALAATWNPQGIKNMGRFSGIEGRAVYYRSLREGRNNQRYSGLTFWTPNINIFRDPRWGRGQETYGEDPFLTKTIGSAIVAGLQGDDPNFLLSAACAKHFAVHSGPEPSRHVDNFYPSKYDLWDTYLPAFKELVTKSKVEGVMCAYNRVDNQPCCGNDLLMTDILKNQWKFDGYVTSDCWGIEDFFRFHKTHKDATSAAADAVLHGTDVECGNNVFHSLKEGVKTGLITEKQIDESIKHLFRTRYRLGMFDSPDLVSYSKIPETALESPEHKALSLQLAQQSMVLLKNSKNTLPLKKSIKKIAVIGPNADNGIAILGNYNGLPSKLTTVLEGIKNKLGSEVEVMYEKAINYTNDTLFVPDNKIVLTYDNQKGVLAEYYNNDSLGGNPVISRREEGINNYWTDGKSPGDGVDKDHFSARYISYFVAEETDTLNFEAQGDDFYRVMIDRKVVINAWERNRWGARHIKVPVVKGRKYEIKVEFKQIEGNSLIRFFAGKYEKTNLAQLNDRVKDADAIIFVGGISPALEGEEMPVNLPGFNGGDRTSIMLPNVQTELMKSLKNTGKPLVFVMMSGSAVAIPWEEDNVPAILNAWYGGESAGTAVADILFGDYNPSGKLPVTFYKSDSDLPDFLDYSMDNRTYRYFKGQALYPFGYGLSFTAFKYGNLILPKTLAKGMPLEVEVSVTNSGKLAGEEVVQLYVSHQKINGKAPIRALKGFLRISLKPGETQVVKMQLSVEDLSIISENGEEVQPVGEMVISVGGGQPGMKNKTTSKVISKKMRVI